MGAGQPTTRPVPVNHEFLDELITDLGSHTYLTLLDSFLAELARELRALDCIASEGTLDQYRASVHRLAGISLQVGGSAHELDTDALQQLNNDLWRATASSYRSHYEDVADALQSVVTMQLPPPTSTRELPA